MILKNKKIIVIGGSGLIGSAIVKDLSSEGAKILVLDIKKPKKIILIKNIKFINYDCSSKTFDQTFNKILENRFKPDVFINCSYPIISTKIRNNFKDIDYSNFKESLEIHLNSYAWLAKTTAEYMRKKKIKGSIIQFSSIYGSVGQDLNIYKGVKNMRENMSYSVIKGGINNLTNQMASYYGRYGIRVNTVSPGAVEGHVKSSGKKQSKKFLKNYSQRVPLKRLAKPSEVASAVTFLSSNLSSYITGTNLFVDEAGHLFNKMSNFTFLKQKRQKRSSWYI